MAATHPGERVLARVDQTDATACWIFPGCLNASGYGSVRGGRSTMLAHRAAYELVKGPIPAGLTIDHLCRTRACVNPAHLEAVTRAENMARSAGLKSHCPQGHPYDEVNTYINKKGRRVCRACRNQKIRVYRSTVTRSVSTSSPMDTPPLS